MDDDSPRVVGFRPQGKWLSRSHTGRKRPADIAHAIIRDDGPALVEDLVGHPIHIEEVTFIEDDDGNIDLIYTAALPVTAALTSDDADDWYCLTPDLDVNRRNHVSPRVWTRLVDDAVNALDPVALAVLEHWRQQVEETTAAMDLLPSYFTVAQLRAVYQAIWGIEPDTGNFHRWVKATNAGVCTEVEVEEVESSRDELAHTVFGRSNWPAEATPIEIGAALGGLVGTGPDAVSSVAAAIAPPLRTVGAVVGGLVAFQSTKKTRGPRAQWYRRTEEGRTVLKELYAPRPIWQQAGITAHPSGH